MKDNKELPVLHAKCVSKLETTDLAGVRWAEVVDHQILFLQQVCWFMEVPPGFIHQKVGHSRCHLNLHQMP